MISSMLGRKHQFEHRGKTYELSPLTQEIKSDMEKKFFELKKETLKKMKDLYDPDEFRAERKTLENDYLEGNFTPESEKFHSFIKTKNGSLLFASVLFGVTQDQIIQLFAEVEVDGRSEDLQDAISLVITESYPFAEELNNKLENKKKASLAEVS